MSIRTFNGQWIISDSGVATSDDCCCDSWVCQCPAYCPTGWGGSVDGNAMVCDPTSGELAVYYTDGDFAVFGWCECDGVDEVQWNCGVQVQGPFCFWLATKGNVPIDGDCFPQAGVVEWGTSGGSCSYPVPAMTLSKNPFP